VNATPAREDRCDILLVLVSVQLAWLEAIIQHASLSTPPHRATAATLMSDFQANLAQMDLRITLHSALLGQGYTLLAQLSADASPLISRDYCLLARQAFGALLRAWLPLTLSSLLPEDVLNLEPQEPALCAVDRGTADSVVHYAHCLALLLEDFTIDTSSIFTVMRLASTVSCNFPARGYATLRLSGIARHRGLVDSAARLEAAATADIMPGFERSCAEFSSTTPATIPSLRSPPFFWGPLIAQHLLSSQKFVEARHVIFYLRLWRKESASVALLEASLDIARGRLGCVSALERQVSSLSPQPPEFWVRVIKVFLYHPSFEESANRIKDTLGALCGEVDWWPNSAMRETMTYRVTAGLVFVRKAYFLAEVLLCKSISRKSPSPSLVARLAHCAVSLSPFPLSAAQAWVCYAEVLLSLLLVAIGQGQAMELLAAARPLLDKAEQDIEASVAWARDEDPAALTLFLNSLRGIRARLESSL